MSAQHVITVKGDRVDIECQNCGTGMNVSATSPLGASLIKNWPKMHKCTEPAWAGDLAKQHRKRKG